MQYEYKCVQFPMAVRLDKTHSLDSTIQDYENKINGLANEGWEYVNADSLTTVQNAGCLGGLLGQAPPPIQHKFLIFRRAK